MEREVDVSTGCANYVLQLEHDTLSLEHLVT
jgi:hypothetical protein